MDGSYYNIQYFELKFSEPYWITGKNSKLSLDNKLFIYKVILKLAWSTALRNRKQHIATISIQNTIMCHYIILNTPNRWQIKF